MTIAEGSAQTHHIRTAIAAQGVNVTTRKWFSACINVLTNLMILQGQEQDFSPEDAIPICFTMFFAPDDTKPTCFTTSSASEDANLQGGCDTNVFHEVVLFGPQDARPIYFARFNMKTC